MAEYFGGGEPISPLYLRGFPFEVVNPSSLELPKDESQDNPKDLFTPGLPFFAQAARIASLDGLTGSLPIGYSEPNNLQDIYLTHPSTPNWDLEIGTFSDPVILEYIGDSPVGCYISADTSPLHGVYAQDSPCLWNIPSIIEDSGRINPDPIATPLFDVTETIIFEEPETKDASPTPFLDGYSKNKDPQRCRVSTAMDFVCPQCSTGFGKLFLLRYKLLLQENTSTGAITDDSNVNR
ncbi:hypothetical protein B0J11DRAFT_505888 [Dendryphion nanum]|uniref:Uncharacterized protein n=1 Tax=Dendryphion nanum TaxID=256645 RepID=A0A9P9DWS8_9PLEO|nr:hypothetical protein B0J11DRAFT_505888 [Dendryphion nanum]